MSSNNTNIAQSYRIISDVGRRRSKVNDACGSRTNGRVRPDMSHDVMPTLLLFDGSALKINVIDLRLKLLYLLVGDVQS